MANMIGVYYQDRELSTGDLSNPLTAGPLNASENEVSQPLQCKVKTQSGFTTRGSVTISFEGTTAAKWTICDSQSGNYQPTLTISNPVTSTGTDIWIKAASSNDESPSNDKTVKIKTVAVIAAAE